MKIRVGFGYDVHRLEDGADLWIGGVQIAHSKGAVGHSDADVLIHAICDALLGAANLGDIGKHFPDTDPANRGIDSKVLLGKVLELLAAKGYRLVNVDSTVCLQQPKIAPHIPDMTKTLAAVLKTAPENVSVKATTTEKLGFVGKEDGIAAYAVALIMASA